MRLCCSYAFSMALDCSFKWVLPVDMKEDYGITKDECDQLIEIGRKYHYETTKTMSKV